MHQRNRPIVPREIKNEIDYKHAKYFCEFYLSLKRLPWSGTPRTITKSDILKLYQELKKFGKLMGWER